jgi:hypothetical protein
MRLPFHGHTGSVISRQGSTFIVRTELGVQCLVDLERDKDGDYYVDVPANWLHTDEERDAVVLQALTAVEEWLQAKKETKR